MSFEEKREIKRYLVTSLITVAYDKGEMEKLRKYYRDLYTGK